MFAIFNPRGDSGRFPSSRRQFTARGRRTGKLALATVGLLAFFLAEIPAGFSAPSSDRPPASAPLEDGFTRETLMEFDAPEPAPFVPAPTASIDTSSDASRARSAAHRRRRLLRHHQPAQNPPPVVVVKSAKHRNPVEGFVYWWNGWVIKTFHTKAGTVMLGTVGAKT